VSGDVQISPVIISHKGLTITTMAGQDGEGQQPENQNQPGANNQNGNNEPEQQRFIKLDPQGRGGADLRKLLEAFNRLKVEAEDRIEILKLMEKSGKLHGKLVME
jgi:flagellar basal body P-ring protein FlgI